MILRTSFPFLQLFLEQKKMLKSGLSISHFRRYIPIIEKETEAYFSRWGDSGQRSACVRICMLLGSGCGFVVAYQAREK